MGDSRTKLVIIGIDGGTWSLIRPWSQSGLLPTFSMLMREGVWGPLSSTIPPVTAPAWTTMMTGTNPGVHGLFDFVDHKKDAYGITYTCGGQRLCPTIWKLINSYGYSTGVINVPMTYPPEDVDGYMISGMDTPDETCPFIFPSVLRSELWGKLGGVRLDIHHLGYMTNDSRRYDVINDLIRIEEERLNLVRFLAKHHPVDVMMVVINSIDQVQHHFWHYMDEEHPRYDPEGNKKFGDAILKIHRHIDSIVSRIMEIFGNHATYFIVSDHGFGPASNKLIRINKALAQGGFLSFRRFRSPISSVMHCTDRFLRQHLSPRIKQKISKMLPSARERLETMTVASNIDWSKTMAYCFEVSVTSPNVWINTKGKRPEGVVARHDYRSVLRDVKAWLSELKDPEKGGQAIPKIYEKNEIFSGPAVEDAPDLILAWWEENGFTPTPSVLNGRVVSAPVVEYTSKPIESGKEWGGTHRMDGIFLAYGENIADKKIGSAALIDVAPTILLALGIKEIEKLEGKPILRFSDVDKVKRSKKISQPQAHSENGKKLTSSEEKKIRDRLKMLGYME